MVSSNIIRGIVDTTNIKGFSLCLTGRSIPKATWDPIFFYHIHKVGGNTVKAAFRAALNAVNFKGGDLIHFDTRDLHEDTAFYPESKHTFISSHFKFGHHKKFGQNFALITVIRDPLQRIISDYHYLRWRECIEPTETDFINFIRKPKNTCLQCQHLSHLNILDVGAKGVFEDAMRNLDSFAAYSTTDELKIFCSLFGIIMA